MPAWKRYASSLASASRPNVVCGAQRQEREGFRRRFDVEPFARFERGFRTAVGRAQPVGVLAHAVGRRGELGQLHARAARPPQAHRDLRHAEVFLQAVRQHGQRRFEIGCGEQRERRAMQLFADRVVLGAVRISSRELLLELVCSVAQRERSGARRSESRGRRADAGRRSARRRRRSPRRTPGSSSGIRRLHLHPSGSFRRSTSVQNQFAAARAAPAHRHSPSNTVRAGPFIDTGAPSPAHAIVSAPPRVTTRTRSSSNPRRRPATTAAQAPVPHASVSPAPRS